MMPKAHPPAQGKLADNVVHFARVLRRAGLPIGPASVIDALQALETVGIERRDDFYFALSSTLVNRREHQQLFDQAFRLFWRDPQRLDSLLQELQHGLAGLRKPGQDRPAISQRVAQAMLPNAPQGKQAPQELPPEVTLDARFTVSARELLKKKDFASMTPQELGESKKMIAAMRLSLPEIDRKSVV